MMHRGCVQPSQVLSSAMDRCVGKGAHLKFTPISSLPRLLFSIGPFLISPGQVWLAWALLNLHCLLHTCIVSDRNILFTTRVSRTVDLPHRPNPTKTVTSTNTVTGRGSRAPVHIKWIIFNHGSAATTLTACPHHGHWPVFGRGGGRAWVAPGQNTRDSHSCYRKSNSLFKYKCFLDCYRSLVDFQSA